MSGKSVKKSRLEKIIDINVYIFEAVIYYLSSTRGSQGFQTKIRNFQLKIISWLYESESRTAFFSPLGLSSFVRFCNSSTISLVITNRPRTTGMKEKERLERKRNKCLERKSVNIVLIKNGAIKLPRWPRHREQCHNLTTNIISDVS